MTALVPDLHLKRLSVIEGVGATALVPDLHVKRLCHNYNLSARAMQYSQIS